MQKLIFWMFFQVFFFLIHVSEYCSEGKQSIKIYVPPHDKTNKMTCAPSENRSACASQADLSLRWTHRSFCCRTCFSMGDLGVQVSVRSSVRPSIRQHLPWVSCERNSSYSFVPIYLKLCRCFRHGMRMCMWFGYSC